MAGPDLPPSVSSAPEDSREAERIRALREYAVLDTEPEEAFDRFAPLAARLFRAPIAWSR
ncbi:hypothetical protein [Deinococcus apachensis]|uniref:hypothetical protein n=1 Tax=Deinococcus apachensis TaxID=309886 RepID=UPI0003734858|nr:hypothetical protein [Deinococcus apachensis]